MPPRVPFPRFIGDRSLSSLVSAPQFTRFLKRDYAKWSEGDDSRSAVACEDETLIESSNP